MARLLPTKRRVAPRSFAVAAALVLPTAACGAMSGLPLGGSELPPGVDASTPDAGRALELDFLDVPNVDLLLVVDTSGSMSQEQAKLRAELPALVRALVTGDVDPTTPDPEYPPVESLRVGVVTTDMGVAGVGTTPDTADAVIPSCGGASGSTRDDERLRYGDDGKLRTQGHSARSIGAIVHDCDVDPRDGQDDSARARDLPTYLSFTTATGGVPDAIEVEGYVSRVSCFANVGTEGCAQEQPLEAALKALTPADESRSLVGGPFFQFPGDRGRDLGHGGASDPFNGGFFRTDSLLAVLVLTDEDDCSSGDPTTFDYTSTQPGYDDPYDLYQSNTRCARYPELLRTVQRYVEGLARRRVGRERMVVFSAITGVPPDLVDGIGPLGRDEGTTNLAEVLAHPSMQLRFDTVERNAGPMGSLVLVPANSLRPVCQSLVPGTAVQASADLRAGNPRIEGVAVQPGTPTSVVSTRGRLFTNTPVAIDIMLAAGSAELQPGVAISGPGLPAGTLVTAVLGDAREVGPFTLRLSEPASAAAFDVALTIGGARGPAIGSSVSGPGIEANSLVVDVTGSGPFDVTIVPAPSANLRGATLTFALPEVNAVPARRIVEVAEGLRRSGASVAVQSICAEGYSSAVDRILSLIQSNLATTCLEDTLVAGPSGLTACELRVTLPPNEACGSVPGLGTGPIDRVPTGLISDADGFLEMCAANQVPVTSADRASGAAPTGGSGWFYDDYTDELVYCVRPRRISFTPRAQPPRGSAFALRCDP